MNSSGPDIATYPTLIHLEIETIQGDLIKTPEGQFAREWFARSTRLEALQGQGFSKQEAIQSLQQAAKEALGPRV